MKLPKAYYEQINKAIAKQQIPSQSFSYIKKRGWVYINHIPSGDYFSFFRKKSVAISAHNHQWENREVFKTKFDWTPKSAAREEKMLNADKIEEKVPAFAHMLKTRHTSMGWKSVLEKTAGMMQDLGNGNGLKAKDLAAIQTPVMILLGTKDQMVTAEESIAAADALAQGHFEPLADAEHPLEKITPRQLADILIDYFKN